jgi:hypothetical protein
MKNECVMPQHVCLREKRDSTAAREFNTQSLARARRLHMPHDRCAVVLGCGVVGRRGAVAVGECSAALPHVRVEVCGTAYANEDLADQDAPLGPPFGDKTVDSLSRCPAGFNE